MRVLITGVSGNIGIAACKLFLSQGWEVVGVSRSAGGLSVGEGVKASLHSLNLCLDVDISNWLESQAPFDLVVMAHGVQQPCAIGDGDFIDTFHSVMDGNLTSAVYLTNELIGQGKLNREALIIYCSSIQASHTKPGRGAYAVAKAGLEVLAKAVTVEQRANRVRAIALHLGHLDFLMNGVVIDHNAMDDILERIPLGWVGCQEVAEFCLDLYKQKSMGGCTVIMDGAHSLNIWP